MTTSPDALRDKWMCNREMLRLWMVGPVIPALALAWADYLAPIVGERRTWPGQIRGSVLLSVEFVRQMV